MRALLERPCDDTSAPSPLSGVSFDGGGAGGGEGGGLSFPTLMTTSIISDSLSATFRPRYLDLRRVSAQSSSRPEAPRTEPAAATL